MSVDKAQVQAVARLAHLSIDDSEIAATTHTLSQILVLVDALQAADTSDVPPLAHPLDVKQRLRADQVTASNQRDTLQSCAPAVEQGLFLVPKVID